MLTQHVFLEMGLITLTVDKNGICELSVYGRACFSKIRVSGVRELDKLASALQKVREQIMETSECNKTPKQHRTIEDP